MPPHDPMLAIRPGLLAEARRRLTGGSSAMCMSVVGALRVLPHAAGCDGLMQALGDAEVQVRVEAVKALAALPSGAGKDGLMQALGDSDVSVRREAARALTRGMDSDAAWRWALVDADLEVHERLTVLEAIKPDRFKADLLETQRRHTDADMGRGAREVLAWIAHLARLPAAGEAGEPDRSRDAGAAGGVVADRSRDAGAATATDDEPDRPAPRGLAAWLRRGKR